jgi:hypothetical protein
MSDEDEPQLHVTRPFSPGELSTLGKVHPEETPPEVPLSPPLSYTVLIRPPDGELIAFSSPKDKDPNRYDGAKFVLLSEESGSFEFPSGTVIDVDASGTMNASEERLGFENPSRGLSGVFLFPREEEHGEVSLTHSSVKLKARAGRGGRID